MKNMKNTKLILAMAPILFGASSIANAQLSNQNNTGNTTIASAVAPAGSVVLYDQISLTPRGNGEPDQNFEAAYDIYDSEAADDFVVPSGLNWEIDSVNIIGSQSAAGTAASVDITFYKDNGGTPGAAVSGCSYAGIATVDTGGSLSTTLPTTCVLSPGTYWMGHITNQDFATSGQHFFSNTDTVSGSEAHWLNPGDGFGTGCTTFSPAGTVCGVGGGAPAYDLLFSLGGQAQAVKIPSLNLFGLALMILSLGFFGRKFAK